METNSRENKQKRNSKLSSNRRKRTNYKTLRSAVAVNLKASIMKMMRTKCLRII